MGKFRKEFIKDSYVNFEYESIEKKTNKDEVVVPNQINFDEEVGVEEMHYQMVKLHQNVKKMQYDT